MLHYLLNKYWSKAVEITTRKPSENRRNPTNSSTHVFGGANYETLLLSLTRVYPRFQKGGVEAVLTKWDRKEQRQYLLAKQNSSQKWAITASDIPKIHL